MFGKSIAWPMVMCTSIDHHRADIVLVSVFEYVIELTKELHPQTPPVAWMRWPTSKCGAHDLPRSHEPRVAVEAQFSARSPRSQAKPDSMRWQCALQISCDPAKHLAGLPSVFGILGRGRGILIEARLWLGPANIWIALYSSRRTP